MKYVALMFIALLIPVEILLRMPLFFVFCFTEDPKIFHPLTFELAKLVLK